MSDTIGQPRLHIHQGTIEVDQFRVNPVDRLGITWSLNSSVCSDRRRQGSERAGPPHAKRLILLKARFERYPGP